MSMSEMLDSLVKRFGQNARVYSVSFDEQGFWYIGITNTDNGEILARYTNAHVRT